MADIYDDPRFRWLLTDSWAGRLATPVLLLEESEKRLVRVRLLADFAVGGRAWSAGTEKLVPRQSLSASFTDVATHVPIAAAERGEARP